MGEARTARDVVTRWVAPTVGMAMLWPLLRYASFFMLLYPVGLDVPLGPAVVPAHAVFLGVLAVAAAGALGAWRWLWEYVERHRGVVALLGAVASAGAGMALGVTAGELPPWVLWASIVCVALGFLALYASWGAYIAGLACEKKTWHVVMILAVSLWLSFVLFSRAGIVGSLGSGRLAAVLMPAGAGVLWVCSRPGCYGNRDGRFVIAHALTPPLLAVAAFLVVGSAVRGIIDLQYVGAPVARGLSPEASALVALAAVGVAAWQGRHAGMRPERQLLVLFAVVLWLGLALVFLGGLFAFLVTDAKQAGGDVVVVSRTLMELVLWLLLCDTAAVHRVPAVPLFLVGGVFVELVSWAVSYVLIPMLAHTSVAQSMLLDNSLVLALVFGVVAAALVGAGAYLVLRHVGVPGAAVADGGVAPRARVGEARTSMGVVDGVLTEREGAVAHLYMRGYSLQKVADELHITKSTAQSHIKHVYRKLDVHSRDELIELFDGDETRG